MGGVAVGIAAGGCVACGGCGAATGAQLIMATAAQSNIIRLRNPVLL
jgi:hypothetical protein